MTAGQTRSFPVPSKDLIVDPATLGQIRAGMDEYAILVFRDQKLSDTDQIAFARLFDGHETLMVYHLMFHPDAAEACPMCSMWVDGFNYRYVAGRKVEGGREYRKGFEVPTV